MRALPIVRVEVLPVIDVISVLGVGVAVRGDNPTG
jgi:hypothetical protein